MPSMGDRCRSGGAGRARAARGCHSPRRPAHLPNDGPVMSGGESLSAEGERTLMGPAAQLDPRAPKAPDPLWAHLLKRSTGREVWECAKDPADTN